MRRLDVTHIVFPISLNNAPGLHIAIAASNASLVVRINRFESSDISPTGYVAFKSAWKPKSSQQRLKFLAFRAPHPCSIRRRLDNDRTGQRKEFDLEAGGGLPRLIISPSSSFRPSGIP